MHGFVHFDVHIIAYLKYVSGHGNLTFQSEGHGERAMTVQHGVCYMVNLV